MVTLEDYKIRMDQADYLLTIKCRVYEPSMPGMLESYMDGEFKDVDLVIYVIPQCMNNRSQNMRWPHKKEPLYILARYSIQ